MSDTTDKPQPVKGMRVKLALVSLMTMVSMVGVAAATTDINASVGPLLDALVLLFVPLLALILAALPIIITMAIIAFILALLSKILGGIKW